jgi:release factor glutamine methyltransferase
MWIETALQQYTRRLASTSETASLDVQVLVGHVLRQPRAWVLAHPEWTLQPEAAQALEAAIARLEGGEPLPYILGHWEFFGLDFLVSPAVLIPRPETELLVETAMGWLQGRTYQPGGRPVFAADVGTGSGCIAVSLAVHIASLRIVATDRSLPALSIARQNARRHAVIERIDFVQCDLLSAFPCSPNPVYIDLICANLPYIPASSLPGLAVARREPLLALDGGVDGLESIRNLLHQAPARLAPGGLVLLEIEAGQGEAAYRLAGRAFPDAEVQLLPDLTGRDRVIRIERPH